MTRPACATQALYTICNPHATPRSQVNAWAAEGCKLDASAEEQLATRAGAAADWGPALPFVLTRTGSAYSHTGLSCVYRTYLRRKAARAEGPMKVLYVYGMR